MSRTHLRCNAQVGDVGGLFGYGSPPVAEAPDRKWHVVSLRLSGEVLPIDGLEARLGITPTFVNAQGTPRRPPAAGLTLDLYPPPG
jgi:hypothetical protein